MYIDTHAHIYGKEFEDDLDAVIARAKETGAVCIFMPATDEQSADEVMRLSKLYEGFLYPMIGLHPEDLPDDYVDVLKRMERRFQGEHPYVAVGEVGLDFYWDNSRKEQQMEAFRIQIEWSLKYHLPLMIHARSAHRELIDCLKPYAAEKDLRGVFHCFTGTTDEAAELLDSFPAFFLGIGGVLTFKKSTLPQVLSEKVPLNRIVLETDSPYMAPVPNRGKRNEPSFISFIVSRLAEVYQVSAQQVESVTTLNAKHMFGV